MKKQNDFSLLMIGIIIGVAVLINLPTWTHDCMPDCPWNGTSRFLTEFEPGTDNYLTDLTHFHHPDWSWSHIEEHVMEPDHSCYDHHSCTDILN